jgi:small subunit ribosomal protein S1
MEQQTLKQEFIDPQNTNTASPEEPVQEEQNFQVLYEESLKPLQEGEVITGTVVHIGDEFVVVDVGFKSEGQVPLREFMDSNGNLAVKIGDTVDVFVERKDDEEGIVILSKEKAVSLKVWEKIKDVYEKDSVIRGKIVEKVKGGFTVDIGIPAFLPGSQIDIKPIKDMDSLIGKEFDFKIVKYNKRRQNVVLSRRILIEAERLLEKERLLSVIKEGALLQGKVKNITDYGIFVDLGGLDGLVHITDISWGRIKHPQDLFKLGDDVKVKVLSYDPETQKISLGIKQLTPDPWADVTSRFPVGKKVKGKVVSLVNYGAFVELDKGVEGLVHVSEMSWIKNVKHPGQVVKVGQEIEAIVLEVDQEKRRISLGMKQTQPNPWDTVAEQYPVGTIIEGRIKNVTDFGVFIGIAEGIDGLVHISDISWVKKIKHPSEIYKKGQVVQAIVLNIDKENKKFSLGIKQLTPDPWSTVEEKYKPGTRVTGTITNITDFGLFVELEEGIEGLVHVSEISKDKKGKPTSHYQVDDVIQAIVLNADGKNRRIGLSIRKLEELDSKDVLRSYTPKVEPRSTLGELLLEELKKNRK